MATITVRSPKELRTQAHIAARVVFRKPLNVLLIGCLKKLVAEAKQKRPSIFEPKPLEDLKPIDRTLYDMLTREGRRTPDDLIQETGCPRATIKGSLERLVKAGYVGTIRQGQATEGQPGAQKVLYVSLSEQ